jgi:hypothetical protein
VRTLKEIHEDLYAAWTEAKRIDHLIYVSLKYTRTVDVLVSVIERMITFFDHLLEALLKKFKDDDKVDVIQKSPGLRCEQLRGITEDETILEIIDFYLFLRKLIRMDRDTINEYKRHVAMVVEMDENTYTIGIDEVTEYHKRIKDYLDYINNLISGENPE